MKQIKYFLGYLHTERVHFLFSVGINLSAHNNTQGHVGSLGCKHKADKHTQVNCWAVKDAIQARDGPARGRALMLTHDLSQVRFFLKRTIGRKKFGATLTSLPCGSVVRQSWPSDPTPGPPPIHPAIPRPLPPMF